MAYVKAAYRGLDLVAEKDFAGAIPLLSQALKESPNPAWIIARSKALVGVGRFREALDDAEQAWHVAVARSKRELIIDAQHRRAVAHYRLGELANADCCCVYAMSMLKGGKYVDQPANDPAKGMIDDQGFWTQTIFDAQEQNRLESELEESLSMPKRGTDQSTEKMRLWRLLSALRVQILNSMQALAADDEKRKCTVSQKPPQRELATLDAKEPAVSTTTSTSSATPVSSPPTAPVSVSQNGEVKLQEYQTNDTMNVTVLSKGVDKTKLKVDFQASVVTFDPIVYPDGREGKYTLYPWADIDPTACTYTVTPRKIEVKLKKALPGKWAYIVRDGATKTAEASSAPKTTAVPTSTTVDAPSQKTAPKPAKNWDAIEYDEEEDESDVNGFFKKLYKGATPEQQRAMMKSFTESSGTSLSTDWDDVSKRTVEAVPPDGVEAKKWAK